MQMERSQSGRNTEFRSGLEWERKRCECGAGAKTDFGPSGLVHHPSTLWSNNVFYLIVEVCLFAYSMGIESENMTVPWPEQYSLTPTRDVPNSNLPALIYRNVLPEPLSAELAQRLCEKNEWEKRGEWGVITIPHFHPNTHECYAVFRGQSRLVLGRAQDDNGTDGIEVDVSAGDVVVVPAGVSHRSLSSSGEYRYIGVYPKAAPRWRNNFCEGEEPFEQLEEEIHNVEIPTSDPVYGFNGPLTRIWEAARSKGGHLRARSKL